MGSWGRAVGLLVVWLVLFELALRALFTLPVVVDAVAFRFGPESELLAWYRVGGQSDRFAVHADLGWVEAPGRHGVGVSTATVSPLGPREPAPPSLARTPGRVRVVVLGDSFALGDDVEDDQTWAARLMVHDPRLETVNLGVGGYDAGQVMLRWEVDGSAWQPDVVLIGVNGLLAARSLSWFTTWQRPLVFGERGDFSPQGLPILDADAMRARVFWTPRTVQVLQMARYALHGGESRRRAGLRRSAAVTEHLIARVRDADATPVIVTLPPVYVLEQTRAGGRLMPESYWGGSAPALMIDVAPALATLALRGRPLQQGTHWTPEVHDEVARLLLDGLVTAGVLAP